MLAGIGRCRHWLIVKEYLYLHLAFEKLTMPIPLGGSHMLGNEWKKGNLFTSVAAAQWTLCRPCLLWGRGHL